MAEGGSSNDIAKVTSCFFGTDLLVSANVVLYARASGRTSGPGPCICENRSIRVSSN